MTHQRCSHCGLVNWADLQTCKRCGWPLHEAPRGATLGGLSRETANWRGGSGRQIVNPISLWRINGIGTALLSWAHHQDGTADATAWFTFLYLPIMPLKKYKVHLPDSPDNEPKISLGQLAHGLSPYKRLTTALAFIAESPLDAKQVLRTYLYAYLLLPLQLLLPVAAISYGFQFYRTHGGDEGSANATLVVGVLLLIWLGYVLAVLARLLHRTRGGVK